jgi:signal transduction histidine kinase/ActR/RegA family two-component response regulator
MSMMARTGDWLAKGMREVVNRLQHGRTLRGTPHYAIARAEARANQAEGRLREALNVLPEGIVFLDNEGRYVLWNDAYADIYAKSADLFREGVRLIDTLRVGVARGDYPQAIGHEEEWLAERMALLDNPGVRHEQRLANGRWILIEERKTRDGGTIGIRIDISEMKAQAEKLEEALAEAHAANQAKSDFLANMSHEIKTPLNGVIGLADVLSRTRLDADQRDLLKTIIASAGDLDNLLGDLLDYSKLEAGKVEVEDMAFDLNETALHCLARFKANAAEKGLQLRYAIDIGDQPMVTGDPARLKQILSNLLSNAVKFTKDGHVALDIHRDAKGCAVISVTDTGLGFDAAKAERLFGRFEQADASTTRQFGGTGLGLSICRQLCDLMGGTIGAVGRPGEGAVFTVVLPLPGAATPIIADPEPVVDDSSATQMEEGDYPPLRIMLVDDNATNRKVVELMLAQVGAETTACENGEEAVHAFNHAPFDLILMDLQMPVMDGLSATRAIREIERVGSKSRTPLVVLSANVSPQDRAGTAEAGADAHIGKPIRADELISTMMTVLEAAEEARAAA